MKENSRARKGLARQGWNDNNRRWLYLSGAVLVVLVIVTILLPRFKPKPIDPAPLDDSPSIGPKTAPVTIIEYGDFGCPSCWYWYKMGVPDQLRTKYGDKIRFVWRDYPVITLLSPKAAEAGQCANDQGKFWEFHDTVYKNEGAINAGDLEAYATAIGLNMNQFNDCVTSRRYRDRVNAEMDEAFNHGYHGAPFFLINDKLLIGAQSSRAFEDLIDPILASK
jgi:protein-disulfide isomerase